MAKRAKLPELIPDRGFSPEALAMGDAEACEAEQQALEDARERSRHALTRLMDELRAMPASYVGNVLAYLMDEVPDKKLPCASAQTMAVILGRTAVWCRVVKHNARKKNPCGGGPKSCGQDQTRCAHYLGAIALRWARRRARL